MVRVLRGKGHMAYFAGGCVRDELLGLRPTDYDVATDATPEQIRTFFRRTEEVGASFGVMLVKPGSDVGFIVPKDKTAVIEVATFRSDGVYTDKRRPDSVTFADAISDARRRDFTINALFLDPDPDGNTAADRVIDHVGGQADMRARVIRAVGDASARLREDHLRALRAARFAARLGFSIEPATAAAIRADASALTGVSRERIGDELRRMLAHPAFDRAAALLQDLLLDGPALDEHCTNPPLPTCAALAEHHRQQSRPPRFETALAAWMIDRGLNPAGAKDIDAGVLRARKALCLSNDELSALRATLSMVGAIRQSWLAMPLAIQKRLAATADDGAFGESLRIVRAIDPSHAVEVARRLDELRQSPSGLAPPPVLTGDDLIAAGARPGPRFKDILDRVYDAQLEGRVVTRAQALELARSMGI